MITSRRHSLLKDMRRLRGCKEKDRALLEGPHLVAEAVASGLELQAVLATPSFLASAKARQLLPKLPRPPLEVRSELLEELADSDSPRGLVAAVRLPRGGAEELAAPLPGIYVYADGLQDPGNLGALARVAEAAGVRALCLGPGTVHPNHPRALRASAGSLLRLPAVRATASELGARLELLSPTWVALVPRGGRDLYAERLDGTLILALGREGSGLSAELRQRATLEITIPLGGHVESLNVATAAAVVLFELRRRP